MRSAERPRRDVSILLPGILLAGIALVCVTLLLTGAPATPPAAAQVPGGPGWVVRTTGPGGVLTSDGGLWVYRPDQQKWLSIDEAFSGEGRETKVLPLPVPVEKIQEMSTWGFILATDGSLWMYDMAANEWTAVPEPPRN